jgi:hypothetical protein
MASNTLPNLLINSRKPPLSIKGRKIKMQKTFLGELKDNNAKNNRE